MLKAPSAAAIKGASNGGTSATRANDTALKALPKRPQQPQDYSQPNAERPSQLLSAKMKNLFTISPGKNRKLDQAISNIFAPHEKETLTSKNNHPNQRSKEELKQIASFPNIESEAVEEKFTGRDEKDQASRCKTGAEKTGKIEIYDDNDDEEEEEENDSIEPDGMDDDDADEEEGAMAAMNTSTSSLLGRLTGRGGNHHRPGKPKQKPATADVVRVEPDMELSNSLLLIRSMQRMERERAAAMVAMHMSHNSIFATPKYADRARQKEQSKLRRAQILEEANAINQNNASTSSLNLQHLSVSSSHESSSSPRHRKVRFNEGGNDGNGNESSGRFYYTGHTSSTSYGSAISSKEVGSESTSEHSMDPLHLRELKPCLKEDRKHSSAGALKNHLPKPMYFL